MMAKGSSTCSEDHWLTRSRLLMSILVLTASLSALVLSLRTTRLSPATVVSLRPSEAKFASIGPKQRQPIVLVPSCNLSEPGVLARQPSRRSSLQLVTLLQWCSVHSYTLLHLPLLHRDLSNKWREISGRLESKRPWLLWIDGDGITPNLNVSVDDAILSTLDGPCDVVLASSPSTDSAATSSVLVLNTLDASDFAINVAERLTKSSDSAQPAALEQEVVQQTMQEHSASVCFAPPSTLEAHNIDSSSTVTYHLRGCAFCSHSDASAEFMKSCNTQLQDAIEPASKQYASFFAMNR